MGRYSSSSWYVASVTAACFLVDKAGGAKQYFFGPVIISLFADFYEFTINFPPRVALYHYLMGLFATPGFAFGLETVC